MRKYTQKCVSPHGEIHLENVYLHIWSCVFQKRLNARISEFPHAEMQAVMCKSKMRIYTILSVFPHAEIHVEMCIPACGKYMRKSVIPHVVIH